MTNKLAFCGGRSATTKSIGIILAAAAGIALGGAASAANAGTVVTSVTINNQTTYPMNFRVNSGQILGTVTPSTPANVPAGGSTTFSVSSGFTDIASLHFYYENTSVSRGCKFDTAYTNGGGWTKSGASSGGTTITCTAAIPNVNPTTHDYSATFTFK